VRVVIENYPEGTVESMSVQVNPEDPSAGERTVPFEREIYIERDDVRETPPPKYWRLFPGNEVRLRGAYLVKCTGVEKDATGAITLVRCTYDPATRGGNAPDGRRVKSTIHWIGASHAVPAEVRLYDTLFLDEFPTPDSEVNARSLTVVSGARVDPALDALPAGSTLQFERLGYFCKDPDSKPGAPVLNRTITLKDTWAKIEKKGSSS